MTTDELTDDQLEAEYQRSLRKHHKRRERIARAVLTGLAASARYEDMSYADATTEALRQADSLIAALDAEGGDAN